MVQVIYTILGTVALAVIVFVILEGMGQRSMAKLAALIGVLHIATTFFSWFIPAANDTKVKISKIGDDVRQFNQSIDKLGNGINKLGATKENIDNAVEKTKIPGLDTADKRIEEWWQKVFDIIGGKSE